MRKIAFIISIIGLFILSLFFQNDPIEIFSLKELEKLEFNQKVLVKGKVTKEYNAGFYINDLRFTCSDCASYLNKNITVIGVIENYSDKKIVRVLRVII